MEGKTKVVVVFYSLYTHAWTVAKAIAEGYVSLVLILLLMACLSAKQVEDVEAEIYQVAETLPDHVIELMHARETKELMKGVPVINEDRQKMMDILRDADALIIGAGTRFGSSPAQLKAFMDSLGQLWASDALVGKV